MVPFIFYSLQVVKANITPLCKSDHHVLPSNSGSFSEYSGSLLGGFAPSQQSKPYLMCTATDAASAIMDFSTQKVDDGVVDSPPERRTGKPLVVASPSPLKRICSFAEPVSDCTPQRQLYIGDAIDQNQVMEAEPLSSKLIPPSCFQVQPSSTPVKQRQLWNLRSEAIVRVSNPLVRPNGLHTRSLGVKPRPVRSASTQFRQDPLFKSGGNGSLADTGCQFHQARDLPLLETANNLEVDAYFKPYSRRKEIMIGYAKVKAQNALLLKTRGEGSTVPFSDGHNSK